MPPGGTPPNEMKTGVWGNLVPPWSRETVMRMAHTARCTRPGRAGAPPAPRLRGHGAGPLPDPPPPGEGTRHLPPAGGGWEGGGTRRTMVTSAVYAARAARRRDEHPSWEGYALPNPPTGWGMGKPGFPIPLRGGGVGKPGFPTLLGPIFTLV